MHSTQYSTWYSYYVVGGSSTNMSTCGMKKVTPSVLVAFAIGAHNISKSNPPTPLEPCPAPIFVVVSCWCCRFICSRWLPHHFALESMLDFSCDATVASCKSVLSLFNRRCSLSWNDDMSWSLFWRAFCTFGILNLWAIIFKILCNKTATEKTPSHLEAFLSFASQ